MYRAFPAIPPIPLIIGAVVLSILRSDLTITMTIHIQVVKKGTGTIESGQITTSRFSSYIFLNIVLMDRDYSITK
ncbi:hypothetical protein DLD82_06630 [Methanospirillum stamsii]|uniref:Uncharacterized protein n=1 Tax=Methanospirillum stamsii TaxID=1277351 RepID=A0A2V2N4Z8_9EURY|nr:hypothetical protein DLD82_06630 [Methanospirillum stamsii]